LSFAKTNWFPELLRNKQNMNLLRLTIGGSQNSSLSWHETSLNPNYDMRKIIGACSALVFAALLGLLAAEKSLAISPPPPAPTNAAPASISGTVSINTDSTSQQ
jgi:hypothetical protein